jgi:hypothetical protein
MQMLRRNFFRVLAGVAVPTVMVGQIHKPDPPVLSHIQPTHITGMSPISVLIPQKTIVVRDSDGNSYGLMGYKLEEGEDVVVEKKT